MNAQNNHVNSQDDGPAFLESDDASAGEENISRREDENIGTLSEQDAEKSRQYAEKFSQDAEKTKPSLDEDDVLPDSVNAKPSSKTTMFLRRVLGGDILAADWMRRQMGVIVLCVICVIIYITNRYSSQHEIIEIQNLQKELEEVRFYGLTRSGELTGKMRQSKVEKALQETPDSLLRLPDKPPFFIH